MYREEALRSRAASRAAAPVPVVISSPSFLALWLVVAAVVAGGAVLTALALRAVS
ncbi:hypothetical protein AB0M95_09770 [Sphaerisporangium sp. NPDC051017]|uniref:hypothetical protein n=1 Tax=unclassified Sphaerisporangium TaxID=2630420 RepID=UPI0033EC8A29